MLIDTGAANSFVHQSHLSQLQILYRSNHNPSFKLADGSTPFHTIGDVVFSVKLGHISTEVHAFVTDRLAYDCILGGDWIKRYGVEIRSHQNKIVVHHRNLSVHYPMDGGMRRVPLRLVGSVCLLPQQEIPVDAAVPVASLPLANFRPLGKFANNHAVRIPDAMLRVSHYHTSIMLYNAGNTTQHLAPRTVLGYVDGDIATTSVIVGNVNKMIHNIARVTEQPNTTLQPMLSTFVEPLTQHITEGVCRDKVAAVLRQWYELFDVNTATTALTPMNHAIRTGDYPPIVSKPHPQSFKQRLEVQRQVSQLLRDQKIRPSDSPWAAPVLLVKKNDGTERLVVDFRKLNAITIKDSYPLPTIEEILNQLGGHRYFSKLDLRAGYHQIPIREIDKLKTAFVTKDALYEWNVLPPGLKNAPPSFQRCMNNIIGRSRGHFCLVYLDDIIIFSRSFEDHLVHLSDVLATLHKHRLRLHPAKCVFFQHQINYLGHSIDIDGLHPLNDKILAIRDFPMPSTLKEANAFIGLVGWYRRFIPDFAKIAAPIHLVTNKTKGRRKEFFWASEQADAFHRLISVITTAPLVLDFPDPMVPFTLSTDASDIGAGAVLKQTINGKDRVVYYFSQLFNRTQRNYSTIEREALAVWLAVNKLRPYLLSADFLIETDHCPLCDFYRKKCRNRRIDCWGVLLADYSITGVKYKKGKCNCDADFLSRYPQSAVDDEVELSVNAVTRAMAKRHAQQLVATPSASNLPQLDSQQSERVQHHDAPKSTIIVEQNRPDNSPLHPATIRAAQITDPEVQIQIHAVNRTAVDDLCVHNGVLFKLLKNGHRVPWIPRALVPDVLRVFHNHPTAAHFGRDRTFDKIKRRAFWPHMYADIRKHIRSCEECAGFNIRRRKPYGLLESIEPPDGIMELVALDFWGPAPTTLDGNRYVLVMTDYLSKYVWAKALPTCTARDAAQFLIDKLEFGVPSYILTDCGTHFDNELFNALSKLVGANHILTTPYRAQSNGQVERWNASMRPKLFSLTGDHPHDWDIFLPAVVNAYNSGLHATTNMTPSSLMFARDIRLPFDPPRSTISLSKPSDYWDFVQQFRQVTTKMVRNNIQEHHRLAKKRYDRNRRSPTYQPGDPVFVRQHGSVGKAGKLFDGPFFVVEQRGPNTYTISNDDSSWSRQVHSADMEPFPSRSSQ